MARAMSRNGYSYVEGNPVNLTDPTGRFPWLLAAAALAVGGVAFSMAWELFVNQGRGVGGAHQFDSADCIDWGSVAEAGAKTGLGMGEAALSTVTSIPYAGRVIGRIIRGQPVESLRQFNQELLDWIGLGDEYAKLINDLYFNFGSVVGSVAISLASFNAMTGALQAGGGSALFSVSGGGVLSVSLVSATTRVDGRQRGRCGGCSLASCPENIGRRGR